MSMTTSYESYSEIKISIARRPMSKRRRHIVCIELLLFHFPFLSFLFRSSIRSVDQRDDSPAQKYTYASTIYVYVSIDIARYERMDFTSLRHIQSICVALVLVIWHDSYHTISSQNRIKQYTAWRHGTRSMRIGVRPLCLCAMMSAFSISYFGAKI